MNQVSHDAIFTALITLGIFLIPLMGTNVWLLFKIRYMMRDYPPHRHMQVEGKNLIIYPQGMLPSKIDIQRDQHLEAGKD